MFASKSINNPSIELANVIYEFEFLGVNIAMDIAMLYASVLIVIGTVFILAGWITLYKNIKNEELVTTGIYSYSRHPQYFGGLWAHVGVSFLLSACYSLLVTPLVVILVYLVSKKEEDELIREFGNEYKEYMKKVPMFIPSIRH